MGRLLGSNLVSLGEIPPEGARKKERERATKHVLDRRSLEASDRYRGKNPNIRPRQADRTRITSFLQCRIE